MKFIGNQIISLWLLNYQVYIIHTIAINPLILPNGIIGFSKLMYYVLCIFINFVSDVFILLKFCSFFIRKRYIVSRFVEYWGVNL